MRHKPKRLSYQQQYKDLKNMDVDKMIQDGRLDMFIVYSEGKDDSDESELNIVLDDIIVEGHFHIVKWAYENNILIDGSLANSAAGNGQIKILNYLESVDILPDDSAMEFALVGGHYATVDWLLKREIPVSDFLYANVIYNGDINMLNLLLKYEYYPHRNHLTIPMHPRVREWVHYYIR